MNRSAIFACAIAAVLAAAPGLAKDDHKGKGHAKGLQPRTKFEQNAERYRYRYQDARCRYEYEYNYRSGRTEVQQKGDCSHVVMPRPVAYPAPLPRAVPMEPRAVRLDCNRDVIGALLGGAIGAVIGAQASSPQDRPVATAGGALIGAVIGGAIGRAMDRNDHGCAYQALEYAQLRQPVVWTNPALGASYTMTPLESYRAPNGADCRRFVVRSVRDGRALEETGRACRQADGRWEPAG